jgi:hypothetical protein
MFALTLIWPLDWDFVLLTRLPLAPSLPRFALKEVA